MSMYSQARACGVDPDAMFDREYETGDTYRYKCSSCRALENYASYRSNYVCPWCGEGIMEYQEDL